jgi:hypothetical protein
MYNTLLGCVRQQLFHLRVRQDASFTQQLRVRYASWISTASPDHGGGDELKPLKREHIVAAKHSRDPPPRTILLLCCLVGEGSRP